jgi:small subunit ribosomal protein S21
VETPVFAVFDNSFFASPSDHTYPTGDGLTVEVSVRDNDVDQALRALKKKMQREGIFREMKMRRSYEKPSERPRKGGSDPPRPQAGTQASGTRRLLSPRHNTI